MPENCYLYHNASIICLMGIREQMQHLTMSEKQILDNL